MTVTPGFNDAHLHPQAIFDENSPYYRVWLGADRVKTMDDLIAALKRKAAITPTGKLISGYGYNDVLLGRHPNRHDLDKVSTTEPIIITHGSGHITVVNSFVLNEAGITRDTATLRVELLIAIPTELQTESSEKARAGYFRVDDSISKPYGLPCHMTRKFRVILIAFDIIPHSALPAPVLPGEARPHSA
jgi:predicted amidohydrolase YtcJ